MSRLETVVGRLQDTYNFFDPNTVLCSDEICAERIPSDFQAHQLRHKWIYTANTQLYTMMNGEASLYFSRGDDARKFNPIFRDIKKACEELSEKGFYTPPKEHADDVIALSEGMDTKWIQLSNLGLINDSPEWSHFDISTEKADPAGMDFAQTNLAMMVFGYGINYSTYMWLLSNNGIEKTSVYVLNPEYVKKNADKDAIARVSRIRCFFSGSKFDTPSREVWLGCGNCGALRGVIKRESDERSYSESELKKAMSTVLSADQMNRVKNALDEMYIIDAKKH